MLGKINSIWIVCLWGCSCGLVSSIFGQRTINTSLTLPTELPTGNYDFETFGNFNSVLVIASPPDSVNELYLGERSGRIIVYSDVENSIREDTPFLQIPSTVTTNGENGLLGLAFHPEYQQNGYFFVFYTSQREGGQRTNRVSRFSRSASNRLAADPDSEVILFDQIDDASNHNGGDIHFGPDGYLYISLGDEGSGNDSLNNSQVIDRDFFAGIARIDVDKLLGNVEPTGHPDIPRDNDGNAFYSIPIDNPLVEQWQQNGSDPDSDLRLEFYAIGIRNAWRMSFDPATGDLWAGDVGQGAREEIDIIEKGGNYGWAFREGFIEGPKSQTPPAGFETVLDPVHDYPRSQGVSVTGGLVYRGSRLPELEGAYIFADYGSNRVWALFQSDSDEPPIVEQITSVSNPVEFATDPTNGDLLISSLSGSVRRLVRGDGQGPVFPETLSETGAFKSLETLEPENGILPYETNLSFWSDHAEKRRWIAAPQNSIIYSEDEPWQFPEGTVWIKHFDLELARGSPDSRTRVETRFLVKTPTSAYGISYRWNESQTDAQLVASEGENIVYQITEDGQQREQVWRIPSRQECMQCHTAVAGYALSFNARQLNNSQSIEGKEQNTLQYFSEIGILDTTITDPKAIPMHPALDDDTFSLRERVRAYLAVNCVSCHQPGATAPTNWDARPQIPLEATGLIGGLTIDNGGNSARRLVVQGAPDLSVLLSRVKASEGFTRMPQIGSNEIDDQAIQLLTEWINVSPPPDATFEEWQSSLFGSSNSDDAQASEDPDHDGNVNYLEFLTFTNPFDPSDFWQPQVLHSNGDVQVTFPMPPSRRYEIQVSNDLENWQTWEVPGNPPVADDLEEIQADIQGPARQGDVDAFLRVRVTK